MKAKALRKYTTKSKTIPNFGRICGCTYTHNTCIDRKNGRA